MNFIDIKLLILMNHCIDSDLRFARMPLKVGLG